MTPLAYHSGRFLPAAEASLSIADAGVVSGATVTDFCRTFGRRLFRWPEHLARLRRDCAECFVPLLQTDDEITAVAHHLVEHNGALLPAGGELALVTFATPGPLGVYAGVGDDGPPTLVMHTFPLSFERYRRFFTEGAALAVVRHSPDELAHVKHRSRMHWWRAGHLLRQRGDVPPGALALTVDGDGRVGETAIGNVLIAREGIVLTPRAGTVLDGVSVRVVRELCATMNVPFREGDLTLDDVTTADEVMICGTAFCVAGVRWVEGVAIAWPGALTTRVQAAWGEMVGVGVPPSGGLRCE